MSTFSFSTNIPSTNNDPADDQPFMQINNASISGLISVDHVGFNVTGGGQHEQVTFNADNVPSLPLTQGVLFTNTVNALSQLFYYNGNSSQSSAQYAAATNGSVLTLGGIIIKWGSGGVSATGSGTNINFVSPFPNNCFVVIAVSNDAGNAVMANTFVYPRSFTTTGFNLLSVLRTSTNAVASSYSYIAIGN